MSSMFGENNRIVEEETAVTVLKGIVGTYRACRIMNFASTKVPLWPVFSLICEQWNNHHVPNNRKTSPKLPHSPDANHYPTGPYPNALFRVPIEQADVFVNQITQMRSQADYTRLVDDFGVRRTDNNFWIENDRVHTAAAKQDPVDCGVYDLSRYENRSAATY